MTFTGELNDCRPGDVLAAVAQTEQSGKLRLVRRQDEGLVLFEHGRVLYAATSTVRETLGSILIAQEQITRDQLEAALELQQKTGDKRLGSILVDQGIISGKIVADAVRQQITGALVDLASWRSGRYEFQPMAPVAGEEETLALADLLPKGALSSRKVSRRLAGHLRKSLGEAPKADDHESRLTLLKKTAMELRSPQFTGELVVTILDFVRQTVRRGVLFLVRPDGCQGLGHVGVDIPDVSINQAIRKLSLPLDEPSLLQEAVERREAVLRTLEPNGVDGMLIEGLGGEIPKFSMAVPMVVSDQVMTVLYVDNLPTDEPIGPVHELELLMIQAGMSIEKNLYFKRIEQYETLRNLDPAAPLDTDPKS